MDDYKKGGGYIVYVNGARRYRLVRAALITFFAATLILGAAQMAAADEPAFLCPVVGDGVLIADGKNGEHGVRAIEPPVGTSLLPGDNQTTPEGVAKNKAGEKANDHAYNTEGPGTSPGPGNGNSDFTPIWPPVED